MVAEDKLAIDNDDCGCDDEQDGLGGRYHFATPA
jgi:hypothetical protein